MPIIFCFFNYFAIGASREVFNTNGSNQLFYFLHYTGRNISRTPKIKIDFHHLTFILEGTFKYTANGKEYTLEKNDAILLPPGTLRERLYIPDTVHYVIFNYNTPKGKKLKNTIFFKNAVNDSIRKYIDACPCSTYSMEKRSQSPSYEDTKKLSILQNLFNCVMIELFDSIRKESKNPHIIAAVKYINDNITSPITLEDVCREIHLSKAYTTRLFKKEMDKTMSEYINAKKLELAKNMLTMGEFSLQDVSGKVGYENYCYFSKIFKERFGISPLKMKKEIENRN